jgi:hypothetical protein
MITQVWLDTTRLDNNKRFLQAINNLAFPFIAYSETRKASFVGKSVSASMFAGYKFSMQWTVGGSSFSDLADQREEFVGVLGSIAVNEGATLKIVKANGVTAQIEVVSIDVDADITARDPLQNQLRCVMDTEYPYLQSDTLNTVDVFVFSGGGMEIPMEIPMDMSAGGVNEVTITNDGNAEAYPLFRFIGALQNPTITNFTTGKTLNVNTTLASPSNIIEVDTFLRTATLLPAGTNARSLISGDFWTLVAGDNLIRLGSAVDTGKCEVIYRDSYYGL